MRVCNCNAKLSIENHHPGCSFWDKEDPRDKMTPWNVNVLPEVQTTVAWNYPGPNHSAPHSSQAIPRKGAIPLIQDPNTGMFSFGIWLSTDKTNSGLYLFPLNTLMSVQNFLADIHSESRILLDTIISTSSPALHSQFNYPKTAKFLGIVDIQRGTP